ncbi:Transmembrane protein 107 [Caenorhabditis elegans]|uniref:Transmembrane protein 107 n=1 Tax=Caenorhabditis elegans TaxID=6239 RepID=H2L2K0_CAEEL|nr:Transmembrane protein 107 [Caenorhabditis elegans]pir/T21990/ hypothetical protein F39B2.9 - Caenorhabditis elegans [Caenorhabditis elegans]CAB07389.1 Transmembrane protein 107 [Caenorhabditis elegans]|eukprot:NP_001252431.1 TMEM (human TransMEMbrane protein) homolog [Caenorhabditis elegans]
MFTKTDTCTKYFQCLMGHFALSTITIFSQASHLEASVSGGASISEEARIGFTVCLVFTKLAILIEFASILVDLPSPSRSLYSTLSHTIASIFFLIFIYDSHPPAHFWLLFAFLSLPPCVLAVSASIGGFRRKEWQK